MLPDFRSLHQRDYLAYLLQISRAMNAKLDLLDLLKMILENSVALISGQAGLIVLRLDTGKLIPSLSIGLPREVVPALEPLWLDIPPEPMEDLPALSRRLALASRNSGIPLRQVVALPLSVENKTLGYIFAFRHERAALFTSNDNQILRTFANHAAVAVHNAYLYRQVTAERERLNAIVENSGDGVMIVNPYRIIKTWNQTLTNLTGIVSEEALGRPCYDVLNLKTKNGDSICHTHCPVLNPPLNGPLYVEGFHERPDGVKIAFADNYSPQLNEEQTVSQYIANIRDVTRLREADDLKETLLAVISHELKTPVSIIKGYAGTLAREDAHWKREILHDGLTVIEEEADKLNDLITNFLEASRLQTGNLKLKKTEIFLPEMAQDAVEMLKATTAKHQFTLDFSEDFPTILGDYERLEQVLTNLISNAIKYSFEGGLIQIGGQVGASRVRLYVSDEGIGIPASEQEQIFERFHRVDNGLTRQTPGTGLGLFLVKAVVQAHGGTVWLDSKLGEGSTFWFSLPHRAQQLEV